MQPTPFAVADADTNWQPKKTVREEWKSAEERLVVIGLSGDKIGKTCAVNDDAIALMSASVRSLDGWVLNPSRGRRASYIYSATERVAAYIIIY